MAKWSVINWDMGITEGFNSRNETIAHCEGAIGCDTAACEEKNVVDHGHCERNSFHGYIYVRAERL